MINTIMYIYVESNYIQYQYHYRKKDNVLMYIVLTDHIVNHFEVHYRDIDKLWDCLNVAFFFFFLINQYDF